MSASSAGSSSPRPGRSRPTTSGWRARLPSGEQLFRRCGAIHHHHLVCRSCNATVEVRRPAVERGTERVAAEHGFTDVGHTLEIFGTCSRCGR